MPNLGVSQKSTLAIKVVHVLTSHMFKNGGELRMPDALKKLSMIEKESTYNAKCSHEIIMEDLSRPNFKFRPMWQDWKSKWIDEDNISFMHP